MISNMRSTASCRWTFSDEASSVNRRLLSTSCTPPCMNDTAWRVSDCRLSTLPRISSAALAVRSASERTSPATTAKPRP